MNNRQRRFAEYIKGKMSDYQLTQADIAEGTDVSFTYISKIANAKLTAPPSLEFLARLADFFDVDRDEVIDVAGAYDKHLLEEALDRNPDLVKEIRGLYS